MWWKQRPPRARIERTRKPQERLRTTKMPILSWILLGLIAGLLGGKIVNRRGEGMFLNIGLGMVGAVTGGYLLNLFGPDRGGTLDLWSVLAATAGAIVALVVYHGVRRMTEQRS